MYLFILQIPVTKINVGQTGPFMMPFYAYGYVAPNPDEWREHILRIYNSKKNEFNHIQYKQAYDVVVELIRLKKFPDLRLPYMVKATEYEHPTFGTLLLKQRCITDILV